MAVLDAELGLRRRIGDRVAELHLASLVPRAVEQSLSTPWHPQPHCSTDPRRQWLLGYRPRLAVGGGSYGLCTQDDAYISFRYADNLVNGHGLVFNPGERVEGITNLLWTVLFVPVLAAGLDPAPVSKMGMVASMPWMIATWRSSGGHRLVLLVAAVPGVFLEAQGLETVALRRSSRPPSDAASTGPGGPAWRRGSGQRVCWCPVCCGCCGEGGETCSFSRASSAGSPHSGWRTTATSLSTPSTPRWGACPSGGGSGTSRSLG